MVKELNGNLILALYKKYLWDLKKVREEQKKLYSQRGYAWFEKYSAYHLLSYIIKKLGFHFKDKTRMMPQLDDIEAEITYLLIREFKPKIVVEISPCGGWSTSWILQAIKKNGFGKLYSYDIVDTSIKIIPRDLSEGRWIFIKGDIKENLDTLPKRIDYLFIDSDHSADFARWYIRNIFPKLKSETPVSIHDIFYTVDPSMFTGEGSVIIDWLKRKEIKYFTAAPAKEKTVYNKIRSIKNKLNIDDLIHYYQANPMIFFHYASG